MGSYKVEVTQWTVSGIFDIEADSPEEASQKVSEARALTDAEWNSFEITEAVEYGFPEPSMVTDMETGWEYDGDGYSDDEEEDDDDEE